MQSCYSLLSHNDPLLSSDAYVLFHGPYRAHEDGDLRRSIIASALSLYTSPYLPSIVIYASTYYDRYATTVYGIRVQYDIFLYDTYNMYDRLM